MKDVTAAVGYDLHNAECLAFMAEMPAASVDLILADPPYMTTNLHFDKDPALDWQAWWAQAWRVVKPAGVVVLFAADLFTVDLILSQRANYRYRLVWSKSAPTGHLNANRQPLRSHEDILVFGQNAAAATYNPQMQSAWRKTTSPTWQAKAQQYGAQREVEAWTDNGTRYPTSVLYFASVAKHACLHPTQKPVPLLRELLRTYSNPSDTVLDCFAGSGSTLEACLIEGRHSIGIELDPDYYAKAQARLKAVLAAPTLAF